MNLKSARQKLEQVARSCARAGLMDEAEIIWDTIEQDLKRDPREPVFETTRNKDEETS